MTDALALDRIDTRCAFAGSIGAGCAIGSRLDEVARTALPRALGDALGSALAGDGVVRIDRIAVALTLDREGVDTGTLVRRWAERLAAAVLAAVRAGTAARFASHGAYVAAYLAHRCDMPGHAAWVFAEFAAARHLSVGEAAAAMLAMRPEHLADAARAGAADWLVPRLSEAQAAAILDAHDSPRDAAEIDAAMVARARASSGWRAATGARRALLLMLLLEREEPATVERDAALASRVAAARRIAALAHLADIAVIAEALPGLPAIDPAWLAALDPVARAEVARVLGADLAVVAGRRRIARDVALVTGRVRRVGDIAARSTRTRAESTPAPVETAFRSRFAGLALLLPTIRDLGLIDRLGARGVQSLLAGLVADRDAAERDPLLGAIMPVRPDDPVIDPPPIPAALLAPLALPVRDRIDGWDALLAARFAWRLPGLEESSTAYLDRQFFTQAGSVRLTEDALTVTLDGVPLGVVLRMGGMLGVQGRLPWLGDRVLTIALA